MPETETHDDNNSRICESQQKNAAYQVVDFKSEIKHDQNNNMVVCLGCTSEVGLTTFPPQSRHVQHSEYVSNSFGKSAKLINCAAGLVVELLQVNATSHGVETNCYYSVADKQSFKSYCCKLCKALVCIESLYPSGSVFTIASEACFPCPDGNIEAAMFDDSAALQPKRSFVL